MFKVGDWVEVIRVTGLMHPYAGLTGRIWTIYEPPHSYGVVFQDGMRQRFGKEELALAAVCPACGQVFDPQGEGGG